MDYFKGIFSKPWIYILITVIGISVKFYKIDYKIFWYDEIATVVQVVGADNVLQIDDSKLNEIAPVSHYTGLLTHKDANYKLGDELKSQLKNMNLNPLHCILLSFWYRVAGDGIVDYRLFSVLVFLLTLPFLFGLAKELFRSSQAGWIAVSLYSVSPFIHYFAQEARYYILWAFLLVAIHYYLIKSIKISHVKYLVAYIVFSVLSLYASILSGLMILEHLIFVFILKKEFRIKFLVAAVLIFLLYSPWFFYVFAHRDEVYQALSWHKFENVPLWAPLLGLVLGLIRTFSFYLNYTLFWDDVFNNITPAIKLETGFNLLILVLMIVAIISVIRREKKETAWFIMLIFIPGLLFFYGLDIARNAITTHWWRYYIFNTIPVVLLFTYLISGNLQVRRIFSSAIYLGLVVISIYSVFTISKYRYWYLGGDWEQEFVDNATLLSTSEKPLMITDFIRLNSPWDGPMHSMEVLANCNSEKIDVLRVSPDIQGIETMIPKNIYTDIFVIYASDELLENLKNQFGERLEILPGEQGPPRWKVNLSSGN